MADAYIIDAIRTPRGIGKAGKGALSEIHPGRLLAQVFEAVAERNHLNTDEIDDVVVGCSSQVGKQGSCIGRMAALDAGWSTKASAVTLDRFCGSGITSVNLAAANIMSGMDDLCVAGGVEMMSYTGTLTNETNNLTVDGGNLHLRDIHPQPHQGICADMIATLEGFSRQDLDALAVESQKRAKHAIDNGHFDKSLITVYHEDGSVALDREEFPRPGTTMETLAELKTVFAQYMAVPIDDTGETFEQLIRRKYPELKINHVHHAGNSSGVVDGAAALILCNKEYADKVGWKPRARIRAMATVG
ncbi:MAG: acetyl-CoA C-acyltransferase, partial [Proteobacteria bacterium]|nr:acetyl-CoA C-acyltransferase [Pseudomonadota bacterium]